MGKSFEVTVGEDQVGSLNLQILQCYIVVDCSIAYYTTMGFSHCSSSLKYPKRATEILPGGRGASLCPPAAQPSFNPVAGAPEADIAGL
jgi:hypothetical protein